MSVSFLVWKIPILFVPSVPSVPMNRCPCLFWFGRFRFYLFRRIDVRVFSGLEDSDFICSGE
jgi:hypothetical protein